MIPPLSSDARASSLATRGKTFVLRYASSGNQLDSGVGTELCPLSEDDCDGNFEGGGVNEKTLPAELGVDGGTGEYGAEVVGDGGWTACGYWKSSSSRIIRRAFKILK